MILHNFQTNGGYFSFSRYKASEGEVLRLSGENTKGKRGRDGISPSFAYTQTIVRLYANDCAPIPKLKRSKNNRPLEG